MTGESVCGQSAEILSVTRGCVAKEAVAILTVRLNPTRPFAPTNLLFSVEQAIRLRDALNREFPVGAFPTNCEV